MKTKLEFNAYMEENDTINKNHVYNWIMEAEANNCDAVNVIVGTGINAKKFKIVVVDFKK